MHHTLQQSFTAWLIHINKSWLSDSKWHCMFQVMASHLIGDKPLLKPMLNHCQFEQTSVEVQSINLIQGNAFENSSFRKLHFWWLFYSDLNVANPIPHYCTGIPGSLQMLAILWSNMTKYHIQHHNNEGRRVFQLGTNKRRPIVCPDRWAIGCLLWVVLLKNDHNISRVHHTKRMWQCNFNTVMSLQSCDVEIFKIEIVKNTPQSNSPHLVGQYPYGFDAGCIFHTVVMLGWRPSLALDLLSSFSSEGL